MKSKITTTCVLLVALLCLAAGCDGKKKNGDEPGAKSARDDKGKNDENGSSDRKRTVKARDAVVVPVKERIYSAEWKVKITKINVKPGDDVKKGDVLYEICPAKGGKAWKEIQGAEMSLEYEETVLEEMELESGSKVKDIIEELDEKIKTGKEDLKVAAAEKKAEEEAYNVIKQKYDEAIVLRKNRELTYREFQAIRKEYERAKAIFLRKERACKNISGEIAICEKKKTRYESLLKGVGEEKKEGLEMQKKAVAEAKKSLAEAEEKYGARKVEADFDGRVERVKAKEGKDIKKGGLIVKIYDTTQFEIHATLSRRSSKQVEQGQRADIEVKDGGKLYALDGNVKSVKGETVVVAVDEKFAEKAAGILKPGMNVSIKIYLD